MPDYLVLLPGDESTWEQLPMDRRQATYQRHLEFAQLLRERGHTILGGAELEHSREALVVRGTLDDVQVTQGPYAETVEQLSGFYQVRTDDLDDLLRVCGLLAGDEGVEVRRVVDGSDPSGSDGAPSEAVTS
jgi:hypothetical protein